MYKFIALFALVAAVSAQYGHQESSYGHHEPSYPSEPIKYQYKYEVNDPHTHDIKSQEESGDGHYVKGYYKLVEPYGGERIVHYSDDGHGFVAHVQTAHISHPQEYKKPSYGHSAPSYH